MLTFGAGRHVMCVVISEAAAYQLDHVANRLCWLMEHDRFCAPALERNEVLLV